MNLIKASRSILTMTFTVVIFFLSACAVVTGPGRLYQPKRNDFYQYNYLPPSNYKINMAVHQDYYGRYDYVTISHNELRLVGPNSLDFFVHGGNILVNDLVTEETYRTSIFADINVNGRGVFLNILWYNNQKIVLTLGLEDRELECIGTTAQDPTLWTRLFRNDTEAKIDHQDILNLFKIVNGLACRKSSEAGYHEHYQAEVTASIEPRNVSVVWTQDNVLDSGLIELRPILEIFNGGDIEFSSRRGFGGIGYQNEYSVRAEYNGKPLNFNLYSLSHAVYLEIMGAHPLHCHADSISDPMPPEVFQFWHMSTDPKMIEKVNLILNKVGRLYCYDPQAKLQD